MSSAEPDGGPPVAIAEEDDNNDAAVALVEAKNLPVFRLSSTAFLDMLHFLKELTLMMLLFVTYAALTNNPPKIARGPATYPFFSAESPVRDFYHGEIGAAIASTSEADLTFVMLYAPWDAESRELRREFEFTARQMRHVASFSAVNCWHPGSECKANFVNGKWPVFFVYMNDGRVIEYHGPKRAAYMIKFLEGVMNPYVRISSVDEIGPLFVSHEAIVLADIDCSPGSRDFVIMYEAALAMLSKDPLNIVKFAVISRHHYNYLSIYAWNRTASTRLEDFATSKGVVKWISKNVVQATAWISPVGIKSMQMSTQIQGPTLILFTPYNPMLPSNDHYSLLKITAIEYEMCNRQDAIQFNVSQLKKHRLDNQQKLEVLLKDCSAKHSKRNSSCDNRGCHLDYSYKTSIFHDKTKSPEKLMEFWRLHQCKIIQLAKYYQRPLFSDHEDSGKYFQEYNICSGNRSLSFRAMNSLRYFHFAERLGLDIKNTPNKTALVIINEKDEAHYVYDGRFSTKSLLEFISNFTEHRVKRAPISTSKNYDYTHVYKGYSDACQRTEIICVEELHSENFVSTINEDNKSVLVFYYTKQCAMCSGISHIYLSTAKILSKLEHKIKFTRIDGELNTLPWEYTMETYPTIILFPSNSKSESRAFPPELPITVQNLLSFILANLKTTEKLQVMWAICNYTKNPRDHDECLSALRVENLSIIGRTLKEWRLSVPRRKRKILYRLEQLKGLHLQLALVPNNADLVDDLLDNLGNHQRRSHDEL